MCRSKLGPLFPPSPRRRKEAAREKGVEIELGKKEKALARSPICKGVVVSSRNSCSLERGLFLFTLLSSPSCPIFQISPLGSLGRLLLPEGDGDGPPLAGLAGRGSHQVRDSTMVKFSRTKHDQLLYISRISGPSRFPSGRRAGAGEANLRLPPPLTEAGG